MKTTTLSALIVAMAAAATLAAPPKDSAPKDFALKGDVLNGQKLYTADCATCHGKAGGGNGIAGLALKPPPASFTDAKRFHDVSDWELFVAVRDGGPAVHLSPAMPPWGATLKPQEVQDVVSYVKTTFIVPARKQINAE